MKNSGRFELREAAITFSCSRLALSLAERNLEEVDFIDEKFLRKSTNNKGTYVDYGAPGDILEDACI